jgi:hypothetical protein
VPVRLRGTYLENDTNFNTIYDWAEIAWTGDNPPTGGNTTQVDQPACRFGL